MGMKHIFLALILQGACLARPKGNTCRTVQCPEGWDEILGKCYIYVDERVTYEKAASKCICDYGGKLVEPRSVEEDAELIEAYKDRDDGGFWIGINDIEKEGVWVYESDGEPVTYPMVWGDNQPDSANEDCRHYWRNPAVFNDIECDKGQHYGLRFICEQLS